MNSCVLVDVRLLRYVGSGWRGRFLGRTDTPANYLEHFEIQFANLLLSQPVSYSKTG